MGEARYAACQYVVLYCLSSTLEERHSILAAAKLKKFRRRKYAILNLCQILYSDSL